MSKKPLSGTYKYRSLGRRLAFQALFQDELNPSSEVNWDTEIQLYVEETQKEISKSNRETALDYARKLYEGVLDRKQTIDQIVNAACNKGRTIDQATRTDRCILRLAAYEMLFLKTPKAVVISEAIELGKSFGEKGTGGFVNGVLDHLQLSNVPNEGVASESRDE